MEENPKFDMKLGVGVTFVGGCVLALNIDWYVASGLFLVMYGGAMQLWALMRQRIANEIAEHDSEAKKLLDEVRKVYTTDDALPNNLLPRIDAFVDGEQA